MIITDNEVSVVRRDAVAANSEQRSAFEWPIGKRMESGNVELLLVFLVVIHLVNGGEEKRQRSMVMRKRESTRTRTGKGDTALIASFFSFEDKNKILPSEVNERFEIDVVKLSMARSGFGRSLSSTCDVVYTFTIPELDPSAIFEPSCEIANVVPFTEPSSANVCIFAESFLVS